MEYWKDNSRGLKKRPYARNYGPQKKIQLDIFHVGISTIIDNSWFISLRVCLQILLLILSEFKRINI